MRLAQAAGLVFVAGCCTACAARATRPDIPPEREVAATEAAFAGLRDAKDTLDALESRLPGAGRGRTLDAWRRIYRSRRREVETRLGRLAAIGLPDDEHRALASMRGALDRDLPDLAPETARGSVGEFDSLSRDLYDRFGEAASRMEFEGRTIDRLTALELLARIAEPARRRALFMAMEPLWRAVNGDGGSSSPYRRLLSKAPSPEPQAAEPELIAILEAWRDASPADVTEPWDFRYRWGDAGRLLASAVPRERLRAIHDRAYRDLGADPQRLGIVYDLSPREGKDPVAYTTFLVRGYDAGDRWVPAIPRVSASYAGGGFDNLVELLHETGHAIHLAAIRTRPAWNDWPDSDVFTEAWADVAAWEAYEPEWQRRYLGIEAPLAASIRSKYASIILDVAWGLFEVRMLRDPGADPNAVWTEITSTYLRIAPHPECSWWAVRGQLVSDPGYMLNYALGAALTADLRERIRALRGAPAGADPGWYPFVSERLLRFGLERRTEEVLADFLGRAPDPGALIRDLKRAR